MQALKQLVEKEFPDMERVVTSSLHKGVVGARHSFLPVVGGDDKLRVLGQVRGNAVRLSTRSVGPSSKNDVLVDCDPARCTGIWHAWKS